MNFRSYSGFFADVVRSRFGWLEFPFKLTFVVTKECHSRCEKCLIWKVKPKNELTLEEITRFAQENPYFSWIHLIGGEPTDREDFPEIVQAFKREIPRLFAVNFPTNGLKPKRIIDQARRISEFGVPKFGVTVSIDGPPDVNDKLRGIPRDFERATETLRGVREIAGIESLAGMTLYTENSHLVEETIAAIQGRVPGFRREELHVNLPHLSSHYYENEVAAAETPENIEEVVRSMLEGRSGSFSAIEALDRLYLEQSLEYLQSKRSPLPCAALTSSIYLSETGEVYPCSIWDKPLGNIRDTDYKLRPILERASGVRKDISELNCPNCWTPCEAYQSILASGTVMSGARALLTPVKRLENRGL